MQLKFKEKYLLWFGGMSIIFIYLWNLKLFPIFADEAIYLHWAQRVYIQDVSPFISMSDGKPPLFIWLTVIIYKFSQDLLFSGRFVSILSLWGILSYVWVKLHKIDRNWANISVFLLAFAPYVIFHSRLALMDMLLASLLLVAVLISSNILLSGLFLGVAFWVKTPAIFLFPLPVIKYLLDKLFDYKNTCKIFSKDIFRYLNIEKSKLFKLFIASIIPFLILLFLKFNIWFPSLFSRSGDFTFSIQEVLSGRVAQIIPNLTTLFYWLNIYLSILIIGLFIWGIIKGVYLRQKLVILLFISQVLFSIPFIIFGKVVASRYYLFPAIVILIIAAYGLTNTWKWLRYLLLAIILIFDFNFINKLTFNPLNLKLAIQDQAQYLGDWSSGIGINSASQRVRDFAHKNGETLLLTEGYFGTLPDGVFVSLNNLNAKDHLEVIGVGNPSAKDFWNKVTLTKKRYIFYLGNQNRIDDRQRSFMKLIDRYPKVEATYPPLELYMIDIQKYYKSDVYQQYLDINK